MTKPSGPLPSPEWMLNVCNVLAKLSDLPLILDSEPINETTCSEISPHVRATGRRNPEDWHRCSEKGPPMTPSL